MLAFMYKALRKEMEALCCAGTNAEKGQDSSETKTNTMGKTGLPLRFPTDLDRWLQGWPSMS